jgi:basic membrane lipoprotein Med (substrate-binding protein (PBP1-ABC) superfamily)
MDGAFAQVIQETKDGKFKGGIVHEDITNSRAVTVLNPALVGKVITPETQKLVEEAGKKLASGDIKIPGP